MNCQGAPPRILLVWGYYRIGWVEPFLSLKDSFEFHFLNFMTKEQDTVSDFDFKCHYWTEHCNAQHLLEKIQPEAIVFMGLETSLPITLNMVAKKNGVPTFYMQHGLYSNLATYLALEKRNPTFQRRGTTEKNAEISKIPRFFSFRFLLKSFMPSNTLQIVHLLRYLFKSRKMGMHHAMQQVKFEGRFPDKYIGFTDFNMRSFYERDAVSKDRVILIGNPYYDIFSSDCGNTAHEKYFLLIDQPLAENRFVDYGVTKEMANAFYAKLNNFAKSRGAKLYIKLHPENYQSTFMLQDNNIIYVRDADLTNLIQLAEGCFGCPSTLMIPCLYYKPSVLFTTPGLQDNDNQFEQFNIAQVLDFNHFEPEEIRFLERDTNTSGFRAFEERYFLKADGKATVRLAKILKTPRQFVLTSHVKSLLELQHP